jgi:DNA-binding helix-hairpin-helix protein with protein kinase domain
METIVGIDGIGSVNLDGLQSNDGAEGTVYFFGKTAIKIFHDPQTQTQKIEKLQQSLVQKKARWDSLTKYVSAVQGLARQGGEICGYAMEAFPGWKSVGEIVSSAGPRGENIGTARSLELLIRLHRAIYETHKFGHIIGDLNERNILAYVGENKSDVRLIDVDSFGMTINGKTYLPDAIDQDICHPDQQKAMTEGREVPFSQKYDWWAFALLAASLLSGNDPYVTGNYRQLSPIERLELRKTGWIFSTRNDRQTWINTRRFGSKIRTILNYVLTKDVEGVFPVALLKEAYMNIMRCERCNLDFNREIVFCPNCSRSVA